MRLIAYMYIYYTVKPCLSGFFLFYVYMVNTIAYFSIKFYYIYQPSFSEIVNASRYSNESLIFARKQQVDIMVLVFFTFSCL